MRTSLRLLIGCMVVGSAALAEVAPVAVRVSEAKAWVGQRMPFFVELRARGSFAGAASFDLPQLPGTLLMKIGNPVVGSQEMEGETWFAQTHEFALFSQRPGPLEVPPFPVRFARRDGFTGPATDVEAQAPGWKAEMQRPPGSEGIGFLVTTESLDVTESWDPQPGPAQVGAVFKRTIVQRAPQVPGMALAPTPTTGPDGIRVYPGEASTQDRLERGDFLGERRETITYLLTKPGPLTLPALTYVWWDPKKERLESKTLPAATFEVAAAPALPSAARALADRRAWPWLLMAAVAVGLGGWQWRRFAEWARKAWKTLHPPDRVAARRLRRACRQHDAAAAATAWDAWRSTQGARFQPGPELLAAVVGLQRHRFGPPPAVPWQGGELARSFGAALAAAKSHARRRSPAILPSLNPGGRMGS
jgi:hypothetical protein